MRWLGAALLLAACSAPVTADSDTANNTPNLLSVITSPPSIQVHETPDVNAVIMPETSPPPEPIHGRCVEWERHLENAHPDWDVVRMSKIMWRESRCLPYVRSSTSDSGLLQINDINHEWLRATLGEHVDSGTLKDPDQNIRAAAALCDYWEQRRTTDCYQPWVATDGG